MKTKKHNRNKGKKVSHNKSKHTKSKHTKSKHTKSKHTKSNKKGKSICSPSANPSKDISDYTCYSSESLLKMRDLWNARHPDVKIHDSKPKLIWEQLNNYMNDVCSSEKCWLRQNFMEKNVDKELLDYTFAPDAPKTWSKNPREWLNSLDLERVMKQYEKKHSHFTFLGPSPIDFDKKIVDNKCVWDDLCNFDINNSIRKNKTYIGVIFNLDPHYKSGSHWVTLHIDIPKKSIFYFDSNGDKMPKEISVLANRIKEQGAGLNKEFTVDQNYPFVHQKLNTECGIYSLWSIINLLEKNITPETLKTKRFSDQDMFLLREKLFNYE